MRLDGALRIALSLGVLLGNGFAFTVPSGKADLRVLTTARFVGGWDNDDFLNSLSSRPDPPERKQPEPAKQQNEPEEQAQGGSRFKELMEASKAGPSRPPPVNPFAPSDDPSANPSAPPSENTSLDMGSISMEEQARLFREFMAQARQAPAAPATPQPRMMGVDAKGRRIGRNRDADTIANTSDLYFAQLKRDSSVRTAAFLRGDIEKSNDIFADEGIQKLNEQLQSNPYIKESREREKALLDIPLDELVIFTSEEKKGDTTYSGVSYRAKLDLIRSKKGGSKAPAAQETPKVEPKEEILPPPPPPPVAVAPVQIEPVISTPQPELKPVLEETVQVPQQISEPPTVEPKIQAEPVVEPAVVAPAEPAVVAPAEPAVVAPAPIAGPVSEDEAKRKLRTLMGMLLKHRGGPGFGSGRLRGAEVAKFEELLGEASSLLQSEVEGGGGDSSIQQPVVEQPSVPPLMQQPSMTQLPQAVTSLTTVSSEKVESAIACVEGAIQMYKNSPPELQDGMLVTLRAAMMSSINTLSQTVEGGAPSNNVAFRPAVDVAVEPEEPPPVLEAPKPMGNDEHSVALRQLYNSLEEASGDGKLGLGKLNKEQAESLVEQVEGMRGILMTELESGIPETEEPAAATPPLPSEPPEAREMSSYDQMAERARLEGEGGTMSKYQRMLMQARAAKAAKGKQ